MRTVFWTDKNGFRHRSWVRDGDPDDMAPQGILQDPPSLEDMDWEAVKRDLHNGLLSAGLFSWEEVQRRGAEDGLRGAILSAMRRRLINLYREANNG